MFDPDVVRRKENQPLAFRILAVKPEIINSSTKFVANFWDLQKKNFEIERTEKRASQIKTDEVTE
jgi:hypothetical protein